MKLTQKEVQSIRMLLYRGFNSRKIALRFKVHHSTIEDIKNNITWNKKRREIASQIRLKSVSGENSHWAKLTERQVKRIKHLLYNSDLSQSKIADRYGVSSQLISLIKTKKVWKHLK